jgi:hypothetical protein
MGTRLSLALLAAVTLGGCSTVSTRNSAKPPPTELKITPELLDVAIPTGTPIADARSTLERFGFHVADVPRQVSYGPNTIDIVMFERTETKGLVSHTWRAALRLRDGKVIDVHATNYLTGT